VPNQEEDCQLYTISSWTDDPELKTWSVEHFSRSGSDSGVQLDETTPDSSDDDRHQYVDDSTSVHDHPVNVTAQLAELEAWMRRAGMEVPIAYSPCEYQSLLISQEAADHTARVAVQVDQADGTPGVMADHTARVAVQVDQADGTPGVVAGHTARVAVQVDQADGTSDVNDDHTARVAVQVDQADGASGADDDYTARVAVQVDQADVWSTDSGADFDQPLPVLPEGVVGLGPLLFEDRSPKADHTARVAVQVPPPTYAEALHQVDQAPDIGAGHLVTRLSDMNVTQAQQGDSQFDHMRFERSDTRNDRRWFADNWELHGAQMIQHTRVTISEYNNFENWVREFRNQWVCKCGLLDGSHDV
jgi:hypothetical protein